MGSRIIRVPYAQGLSVFTALQRQGIPSELLYFPNENHWVLKPADSIQWYETVLEMARTAGQDSEACSKSAAYCSRPRHAAG